MSYSVPLAAERAVFLIKPDGMYAEFREEVDATLDRAELKVMRETRTQLRPEEIALVSTVDTPEYIAYMCEAPVAAMIVEGRDAIMKGRLLKGDLRKKYGRDGYRNLLHTSEPGNEYELQTRLFFGDVDDDHRLLFADQCASLDENCLPAFGDRIEQLRNGGAAAIGLVSRRDATAVKRDVSDAVDDCPLDLLLGEEDELSAEGQRLSIIRYRWAYSALDGVWHPGDRIVLVDVVDGDNSTPTMLAAAKAIEAHGVLCYSPRFSLVESERRRVLALKNGFFCVGGSQGGAPWGRFGVSREVYSSLSAGF